MAQFLKEEIAREIEQAGLRDFAARGYRAASMADIALEAGISTGNVYRYFASKQVLFAHVVPRSLQGRLLDLLAERVRNAGKAGFAEAANALREFSLTHRLELVIMLGRAEETMHAGFAATVRARLEALALEHYGVKKPDPALAFALREVYAHFVSTMVQALEQYEDPLLLAAAVERYTQYHAAGLRALFEGGDNATG